MIWLGFSSLTDARENPAIGGSQPLKQARAFQRDATTASRRPSREEGRSGKDPTPTAPCPPRCGRLVYRPAIKIRSVGEVAEPRCVA